MLSENVWISTLATRMTLLSAAILLAKSCWRVRTLTRMYFAAFRTLGGKSSRGRRVVLCSAIERSWGGGSEAVAKGLLWEHIYLLAPLLFSFSFCVDTLNRLPHGYVLACFLDLYKRICSVPFCSFAEGNVSYGFLRIRVAWLGHGYVEWVAALVRFGCLPSSCNVLHVV